MTPTEESIDDVTTSPGFLRGGGAMGDRMRAFDWSATAIGPATQWPQSLKTIVRVMLDSRYAMWMLWGPDYTFFCNDAYLPTVGNKADWVLGARSDKVWEEIWPDIGPRIAQVLEHGEATWDEALQLFLERRGFAEETFHTFSYSPVYDDTSRIAGMLCVVTEVTDRVIDERRLRILRELAARGVGFETVEASGQRFCEVLDRHGSDVPFAGVYLLDVPGEPLRLLARTSAVDSRVLPLRTDVRCTPWPFQQLIDTPQPLELQDLPALGLHVNVAGWSDPVRSALLLPMTKPGTDTLAGILVIGVSPRRPLDEGYRSFLTLIARQMAAAIADASAFESERRRAESLAELDRAKMAFFSNVSHEFRTPLTLMLGPVEQMLEDPRLPAPLREPLDLAQRNAHRLLKLVNSLLDFSRIEAGRAHASFAPTDLAALTRDLASTFRSAIERAGLAFDVDCTDLGEPVYVDRDLWEKIVLNLLSNAFKFTFTGGIVVTLQRGDQGPILKIQDSGVGIDAAELSRIFERFHRIEGAKSRTQEGSGIGLALVQELVRLHGGTIEAASEPARGTQFTVRIPYGRSHLVADLVQQQSAAAAPGRGTSVYVQEALRWLPESEHRAGSVAEPTGAPRDPRFSATFGAQILVADDNADMRSYVCDLLRTSYSVCAVPDGEQAIAVIRGQTPDLIISDVMMPGLDGFGLLAAIRGDDALKHVPVVLLSARAGEEARIEGFDAGADDYIVKPFSARELLARVGALLELTSMRRRSEQALRQRTAQFETLLNDAPVGVFLVDADLRIREVNPLAKGVFAEIPDLIGHDLHDALRVMWPAEEADRVTALYRRTLASGEPHVETEFVHTRLDRQVAEYYEWRISRIALPHGRWGVVCYFSDVSLHIKARNVLEDSNRQKNEFLAMLAHELRNPLAPISSAAELLARTILKDSRSQTAISIIRRQVTQMTRLVDDLLDVSRLTLGRIDLRRAPIELNALLNEALDAVEPLVREKRHRLSVTSAARQLYVDGDAVRLVQCIVNVLTNAAKYTDPPGDLRVELRGVNGTASIRISDSGAGIAPELLPRIFDLFVQSDRTLDRSQGGLGIGLAVVRRLMEMHGGTITARSDGLGLGSTFELLLPRIEAPVVELMPNVGLKTPVKRVLIVDDNADAAQALALTLALDGHETQSAYSARAALELLDSFRPEVVLLDIGLPEMNGREVAQRIRQRNDLGAIRLIALTGYGQPADRRLSAEAGFDDHLVKPVDYDALLQSLE